MTGPHEVVQGIPDIRIPHAPTEHHAAQTVKREKEAYNVNGLRDSSYNYASVLIVKFE